MRLPVSLSVALAYLALKALKALTPPRAARPLQAPPPISE